MFKTIEVNGNPIADGQTVSLDHSVQEFKVTIRSLAGIDTEKLKNHLQKLWEVTEIQQVNSTDYVRTGLRDF